MDTEEPAPTRVGTEDLSDEQAEAILKRMAACAEETPEVKKQRLKDAWRASKGVAVST